MNGILYIPYVNTELSEDAFDYNGGSIDYISQLNNVGDNIIGAQNFINKQSNTAGGFYGYHNPHNESIDQILHYELECEIFNAVTNASENIETLLEYNTSEDSFMLVFSFDHENTDEDCLIELKSWISESKKVMSMPDTYGDELKMELLPRRNFKLKINDLNSELTECIFYDNYENKIVIFVKQIIFNN